MIKSMGSEELKALMDQGNKIVLVDCREQAEWDAGHIEGAIFMPLSDFQEQSKKLDKNSTIIMQCRSGQRSLKACQYLESEGYSDLTNLEGGIMGWISAGHPVSE